MPAKIDEIDKVRRKRSRKAFLKRAIIFLLIALLIFALFIGMRYASDYDIGGFVSDTIHSIGSGPGFPIDFAGGTVLSMYPAGKAVALLTDTGFYIYKTDAKQLIHTYFDYSDPVVTSSRNRFLIYDCFGYSCRIESRSDTVFEKTFESKVICADYSRSGHRAIVTESPRSLALVSVRDKNGNEIFSWTSTENYITGCSLSPDGKNIALSGLTTVGGMLRSVVISFNISNGNENFRKYYDNTLIYDLSMLSRGRVCVIMEDAAELILSNGSTGGSFDCSSLDLVGFRCSEGGDTALIFRETGSNDRNAVVMLDELCNELFTLHDVTFVREMFVASDGLYILNDDGISFYNKDGMLTKKINRSLDILHFTVVGQLAYAVTEDSVLTLEFENVALPDQPSAD